MNRYRKLLNTGSACARKRRCSILQRQVSVICLNQPTKGSPDGGAGGPGTIRGGSELPCQARKPLSITGSSSGFRSLPGWCWRETPSPRGHSATSSGPWIPYIGEAEWVVLNFIIEFATLFCLVFLLTGLVLSISSKKDGHVSFFEGLTGAKKYIKAIFVWSFVLALAGMLLFSHLLLFS